MMKRLFALLVSALLAMPAFAQFTSGQILTAAGLNSALAAKANNAVSASSTGAVSRTLQAKLADDLSVADFDTAAHAVTAGLNKRLIVPYGTTLAVNVPGDAATTQAAMTAIRGWSIYGTVNIIVAAGTISESSGVSLMHPYGQNINIFGPTVTPGTAPTATISFNGTSGYYVPPGWTFGAIDYLNIVNVGTKGKTLAVYSDGGKISRVGPNALTISGFYYGIAARFGAYVNASGSGAGIAPKVDGAGDAAFWSYGGVLACQYCVATNTNDSANSLGTGFVAEFSGSMDASYSVSTGNWLAGYGALSGSAIRAWGITSQNNTNGVGLYEGGIIEVFNGSTINNNTGYGYTTDGTGYGAPAGWSSITNSPNTAGDHQIAPVPGAFSTLSSTGLASVNQIQVNGAGARIDLNSGGPFWRFPTANTMEMGNGVGGIIRISSAGNFLAGKTGDDGSGNNVQSNTGLSINPATTTTAPSAGGAGALPATPLGYMTIRVNGTDRKVAYY